MDSFKQKRILQFQKTIKKRLIAILHVLLKSKELLGSPVPSISQWHFTKNSAGANRTIFDAIKQQLEDLECKLAEIMDIPTKGAFIDLTISLRPIRDIENPGPEVRRIKMGRNFLHFVQRSGFYTGIDELKTLFQLKKSPIKSTLRRGDQNLCRNPNTLKTQGYTHVANWCGHFWTNTLENLSLASKINSTTTKLLLYTQIWTRLHK
mmetsp:Transcript_16729/g.18799  ORF Transcript_16729/g.18799 Transcript_16729/m.18799 type:complete len:207 (-) Transcript_16729:667-1287(-)